MSALRPQFPTRPFRIVIADDHEWIRQIAVQIAEQTLPKAEIISTEDGQKALEAIQRDGCDFLVSNHCMPHLDGFGLVREVRKTDPDLPILMISIDSAKADESLEVGANYFLVKEQIMEHMPSILRRNAGAKIGFDAL